MNVRRDGFKPKGAGSNVATKSRWPSPDKYPPIVVDNFFNDPDTLVRLGKTLPNEVVSRQPGRRSKQMWEIDEILHNASGKLLNRLFERSNSSRYSKLLIFSGKIYKPKFDKSIILILSLPSVVIVVILLFKLSISIALELTNSVMKELSSV